MGVLVIGSELVAGTRVDTNSAWLHARLPALGLDGWLTRACPDHLPTIAGALREAAAQVDLLLTTGGLGPTSDDLTRDAVAEVLGASLELDAPSLEHLNAMFARFGRTPSPSNRRQCVFPRGARVLRNEVGTAPGFAWALGPVPVYCLPGVPREVRWIWEDALAAELAAFARARGARPRAERIFRTVGIAESALGERLDGLEGEAGVEVRYCVEEAHGTIEVRLLVEPAPAPAGGESSPSQAGVTPPDAEARADALLARARELLTHHICAEGGLTLAEAVGQALLARGTTVAVAESCTGGRVAAALTALPGISAVFREGLVTYSNEAKTRLLGVPPALLAEHGAVSAPVARAMADGARAAADADLAVATTGIAGPGGATDTKPVGLVHFAVARRDGETRHVERRLPGTREQVQVRATAVALEQLLRFAAPLGPQTAKAE